VTARKKRRGGICHEAANACEMEEYCGTELPKTRNGCIDRVALTNDLIEELSDGGKQTSNFGIAIAGCAAYCMARYFPTHTRSECRSSVALYSTRAAPAAQELQKSHVYGSPRQRVRWPYSSQSWSDDNPRFQGRRGVRAAAPEGPATSWRQDSIPVPVLTPMPSVVARPEEVYLVARGAAPPHSNTSIADRRL
jgi:hypothetical protein